MDIRLTGGLIAALAMSITFATAAPEKKYLSYELFGLLTGICPELKAPSLPGLSSGGRLLWAKGQMQMPAETHLYEGDFNDDGKPESALAIADGGKNYLVVAHLEDQKWRRTGFVPLGKSEVCSFNGRAFALSDNSFVTWDGTKYRAERGPLALYCCGYEPSDFFGVAIKITYVGPQDKPLPGLMISSFYRVPDCSKFKQHRRPNVSYGNDDIPVMWCLTLAPAEVRRLVLQVNRSSCTTVAIDRRGTEGTVLYSLSILDTSSSNRPNYFEAFLSGAEMSQLLQEFSQKVNSGNADGAKLLREYRKTAG